MESTGSSWWHRHGWTVVILLSAFSASMAIRSIFTAPIIQQFGPLYVYGGGSDSFYHSRVMEYIIYNHTNLIHDPLLRYPTGAINPREPLFDWMNAVLGIVFAPFFGGNAVVAGAFFLDLQAPLWSALGVFPVYLIGKEVADRRTGLIAAVIFPFLVANIDSSVLGYANYLSFYTFFILVALYAYLRTVRIAGSRRWVTSYRNYREYLPALRSFLREERTAVKWAVFTGVAFGALAMAWQGYSYIVAIIAVFVVSAMIIERIRKVDSFGLYVLTWIVGLVGFPIAMPYYLAQGEFAGWFDLPLVVYFGALLLLLPFLLLRDVPWVFSIPVLVLAFLAGAGLLAVVEPGFLTNILTGQGYFVKTLVYSTVAEAQAPSFDALVIGYGIVTFFLAFVGLALYAFATVRGKFPRVLLVFLVFAILSIYLPISAAKFFLIGSPAFALLPALAIKRALDVGLYPELRRNVASLSDRRSQFSAFRRAFKPRHALIMLLVVGLLLPNIWFAIDAGIPGNSEAQFSTQIYDTLPPALRPAPSQASSFFLGAAGTELDTPNQYDESGYNWLATQDTNLPQPQRPAFISWWDYGFQAIAEGDHPSVADNFQNGITPSGQFLLSQNESNAIAILSTTLLAAEVTETGQPYLPSGLNKILAQDGLGLPELHTLLANQSADVPLVLAHPERYLPVDPSHLSPLNAMYMAVSYYIASSLPLSGVAKVYDDIQAYTGWSIRYDMVDSRLFPFSGSDTGIFYAPADLTDRIVNSAGIPVTYYNVTVLGSDGTTYPAGEVPAGVSAVSYNINYFPPFYNSMLYRTYIGYNGTQIGLGNGIPGLTGNAQGEPVEPAWMLQHFEVVYRTAYYCPSAAELANNSNCLSAMNLPTAVALANKTHGVADTNVDDYFSGGETMLEYYPGQPLLGEVQLPNGAPDAGVRVTVFDSWGIPHMTTTTSSDGSFSLILPPGNDTLNVTAGPLQGLTQQGSNVLETIKVNVPNALGLSLNAPTLVRTITLDPGAVQGFLYWAPRTNATYSPGDPLVSGAKLVLWGTNVTAVSTTTDASGAFDLPSVAPGEYQVAVLYRGQNLTETPVIVSPNKTENATAGLTAATVAGSVLQANGLVQPGATVTIADAQGVVGTTVSATNGTYSISSLGKGNYTLLATGPAAGERSSGVLIDIRAVSATLKQNLTVLPTEPVSLAVTANGNPVPNLPVRFTLFPESVSNASAAETLVSQAANATVATTGATGVATTLLPYGNYSVYAVGYVGSTVYAGFESIHPQGSQGQVPGLVLQPAVRITGTIVSPEYSSNGTISAVELFDIHGNEVTAVGNRTNAFTLLLPAGTYSMYSVLWSESAPSAVFSSLASVALTFPVQTVIHPVASVIAHVLVGSPVNGSTTHLFGAAGATLSVSVGLDGPTVWTYADGQGRAALVVPSTLVNESTYCLASGAPGFSSTLACGLAPSAIGAMTQLTNTLLPVPVSLHVVGLPYGTGVTVNFTSQSETAQNASVSGGPNFSFTLYPGQYGVSAFSPGPNRSTVYLPAHLISTTIAVGAVSTNLTLVLALQRNSTGTLVLPPGVDVANATVSLTSALVNVTVNGTAFESGFFAAPGTYSAYAVARGPSGLYAALTPVTINATGTVLTPLAITSPALTLNGSFQTATGSNISATTPVLLTSPSGGVAVVTASDGTFQAPLPANAEYGINVRTTLLVTGLNGSYYQTYANLTGASCALNAEATSCRVTLSETAVPVWWNGTLVTPGAAGAIPGTLRLVGPYPSTAVTVVSSPLGTFSAEMTPGSYWVYASGTEGTQPLANFTSVDLFPSVTAPSQVSLTPAWTDTITVSSAASPGLTNATVTVRNAFGVSTVYPGVGIGTPVIVPLARGNYTVSATASGSPYGVLTNASTSRFVGISGGNLATVLTPYYQYAYSVSGAVLAPTNVTVHAGGTASFAFVIRNTGSAPVTVRLVGSPAYWTFAFPFTNVTLGVSSPTNAVGGEIRITVPNGTAVAHPPVTIEAVATNGTVVGTLTPGPTLTVVPYYGLQVGKLGSTKFMVGTRMASVPFFVHNSGNVPESMLITVTNGPQLASLGWSYNVTSQGSVVTSPPSQAAGANVTYAVNLTAIGSIVVPPPTVSVTVTVLNASGGLQQTATISVPIVSVKLGTSPVLVTGPSVGAAPPSYPVWLVPLLSFVPAIALVVGLVTWRWYRTRKWVRR